MARPSARCTDMSRRWLRFVVCLTAGLGAPSVWAPPAAAQTQRPPAENVGVAIRATDSASARPPAGTGDTLPLAPNTSGLSRPRFPSIEFVLGAGISFHGLSQLAPLVPGESSASVLLSTHVRIPFSDEGPSWSFMGGWGSAIKGAGGLTSFTGSLLYQSPRYPIIGIGAGRTWYNYRDNRVAIRAAQSYPLLVFGTTLVPFHADILLSIPRAQKLTTSFQSRPYTITLAGTQLNVLLRL